MHSFTASNINVGPLCRCLPNAIIGKTWNNTMYASLDFLDIYYLAVCVEAEPLLGNRCLDRVLGVEDLVEFLELLKG
jgi:hypothetical protein